LLDHERSASPVSGMPASSGRTIRHSLHRGGNRQLNRPLYTIAITEIRGDTEGRAYYRRKRAAGKQPMEAVRCLKRRISDAIYRQLVADAERAARAAPPGTLSASPGGHCGASQESSAVDLPPHIDTSDQPLPGPARPTLPAATTPANPTRLRLPSLRVGAPEPSTWSAPPDERR
jgi:transposase